MGTTPSSSSSPAIPAPIQEEEHMAKTDAEEESKPKGEDVSEPGTDGEVPTTIRLWGEKLRVDMYSSPTISFLLPYPIFRQSEKDKALGVKEIENLLSAGEVVYVMGAHDEAIAISCDLSKPNCTFCFRPLNPAPDHLAWFKVQLPRNVLLHALAAKSQLILREK